MSQLSPFRPVLGNGEPLIELLGNALKGEIFITESLIFCAPRGDEGGLVLVTNGQGAPKYSFLFGVYWVPRAIRLEAWLDAPGFM